MSTIDKTEERGITILQLTCVFAIIEQECHRWLDLFQGGANYGQPLNVDATNINLHHTKAELVGPGL